jgi:hypothetical protein
LISYGAFGLRVVVRPRRRARLSGPCFASIIQGGRRRAAGDEAAIDAFFDRLARPTVLGRRSPDEIIGNGPQEPPLLMVIDTRGVYASRPLDCWDQTKYFSLRSRCNLLKRCDSRSQP